MTNKTNSKVEVVYKGKMFEVIKWEGKPGVMFETAVRAPGVRLVIECDKDGQKALLMTKEFRRERGREGWDFRLPGGKVFDSLDELNQFREAGSNILVKAKDAAIKEGKEEAGISGGTFIPMGISKAGASVEWDLHYFLVQNAYIGDQELEEHEQGDIETIKMTAQEIFDALVSRKVQEGRSADILWFWLAENKFIQFSK